MKMNENMTGDPVDLDVMDWMEDHAVPAGPEEVEETITIDLDLDLDNIPEGDCGDAETADHVALDDAFDFDSIKRNGVISQDSLASALGKHSFDKNAKYVSGLGSWVLFGEDTGWMIDDRGAASYKVRNFLRDAVDHLIDEARTQEQAGDEKAVGRVIRRGEAILGRNAIIAVEALARENPGSAAKIDDFDVDLMLLGTPGGIVDLKTGELRPHDRADLITKRSAVTPAAPGARPQRWLRFMDEVFEGDQEKIAMLQRIAGYALTGSTKERVVIYLHGKGGDGKSTTLRVLSELFGEYSQRAHISTFLHNGLNAHPTNVAALRGARLVTASELPENAAWNDQVLKELTGREVMSARRMHQNFFQFIPQLTLLISGNHLPNMSGVDKAMRDRFIVLPYNRSFTGTDTEDQDLPEKLIEEEGAEILRWCIDGCLEWQKVGIKPTASVKKASASYMDGEDIVGKFLSESVVLQPGAQVMKKDLFRNFIEQMDEARVKGWTQNRFTKALLKLDIEEKRSTGGQGAFVGLRFRTAQDPD